MPVRLLVNKTKRDETMMKNKINLALSVLLSGSVAFAAPTLEERVAELEAQNSLNIFSFSGTLNTRYDELQVNQTNPSAIDTPKLNYMRMRFSFNVDAAVSPYIKFYSRYTMTKMMNSWRQQGTVSQQGIDLRAADNYLNSGVVVEKAYADLTIPDSNFIFSIGRLPTTDGQPANYWDGKARMGTYALMAYGSVLDGMALTYKADSYLPSGHTLALRFLYTPFTDNVIGNFQTPPTSDSNASGAQTGSRTTTMKQFSTQQIDYSTTAIGAFENLNIILQHYNLQDLEFAHNTSATPSNLAIDVDSTSLAIDMQGLFGSNFDLSLSELVTAVKSKGLYGASAAGYGTTLGEDTTYGSTTLISTRYKIPTWIFGVEYIDGKKGVFYTGNTAEDLTNFYGTPGTGTHLYITKKFVDNLSLRIGHYNQNFKYSPLTIGSVSESDKNIKTYYANLRLDF